MGAGVSEKGMIWWLGPRWRGAGCGVADPGEDEVDKDSRAEVVVSFRTSRFVIYASAVGVGLSLVGPRAHIVLV